MNQLLDELKAEQARPIIDDAPGYTAAQTSELEHLAFGHLSHRDLANKVRMLMRTDFEFEGLVVAARDRIAWLAARVEELEAQIPES